MNTNELNTNELNIYEIIKSLNSEEPSDIYKHLINEKKYIIEEISFALYDVFEYDIMEEENITNKFNDKHNKEVEKKLSLKKIVKKGFFSF